MTSPDSESLEVGVVGAGSITEHIHAPIVSALPATEIAFVVDVDRERAEAITHYGGRAILIESPDELPRCDVAVLAIPVGARRPYLATFGDRDVPVFAEKPFAPNSDAHDEFLDLNERAFCDYMRTCFSSTRQARGLVRSGVLGPLESVDLREEGKVGATGLGTGSYQTDPDLSGGGVLLERGCHSLSQLSVIFDGRGGSVADADVTWNGDLDAAVTANLRYETDAGEVPIRYRLSETHPVGNRVQFIFEHAVATFDQTDPEARVAIRPRSTERDTRTRSPSSDHNRDRTANHEPSVGGHWERSARPPIELAHAPAWASESNEAFQLRWLQFLSFVRGRDEFDAVVDTAPDVTDTITEIYAAD